MIWEKSEYINDVLIGEMDNGFRFQAVVLPPQEGMCKYFVTLYAESDQHSGGFHSLEEAVQTLLDSHEWAKACTKAENGRG